MTDNRETVSVTDSVDDSQISITESQIMSEGVQSIPVTSKKVEDLSLIHI